jgi:lipoprotein-releasing system permease protein
MTAAAGSAAPFSSWERSVAARYLRAKRHQGGVALISIISFVGILLAVAVLIIVMSVMNGFRTELLDRILGFNGHAFVAGGVLNGPERDAAIARLRAVPGVTQAQPIVEQQVLVQGAATAGAYLRGVTAADLRATPIIAENLTSGSLEGFGDGEYGGDLIVVGARLADSMGVRAGDPLTLTSPNGAATAFGSTPRQKTYTVGAVFEAGMSEYDAAFLFMPLPQAQAFAGRGESVDFIEVRLSDPDDIDQAKPALDRAAGPTGILTDWRDRNRSFFEALAIERNVMRLILMLIVAIAAMNIISGLVMLVKNKGRDIAILRTMGATQSSILRIFLMAGASIGVLGTLAGLTLGILFCLYIEPIQRLVEWATNAQVFNAEQYFLSRLPADIEWSEVVIVVGWALFASVVATLPPAWRASRLDPVEGLRNE